jgi:hypothetical protein
MSLYSKPPVDLPVSRTTNPYWDIVRTIPGSHLNYDRVWQPDYIATYFDEDGHIRPPEQRLDRNDVCGEYAWAIPDPASLDFVAQWCTPKAVEIGAGTGYWAWQLSQLGVDIVAYDLHPPQHDGQNHYHSPRNEQKDKLIGETRHVFYDVLPGDHLMPWNHPDRTLFLCWPPYSSNMANLCLKAYQGKRLVYIGEQSGGCNADDAFFKRLERNWEEVATHRIIQWSGLHDYIIVYERREVAG